MNLHNARPHTKRAAGVALMNAIGGTSNIWGSYLYKRPPRYYEAFGTRTSFPSYTAVRVVKGREEADESVMGLAIIFMIVATGYRFFVRHQNKLLDSGPEGQKKAMRHGVTQEQVDMGWRYECY